MRRLASLLLVALAPVSGCTCGAKPVPAAADAAPSGGGPVASTPAPAGSAAPLDASVFSAPIAATRANGADVIAGLVASTGVVRIMGLSAGRPTWAADVLRDLAWTPDAELHLQPVPGGFVLVWRGTHGGKNGRTLVLLGPHGEVREPPREVGAAICATSAGVAWIESKPGAPARVLARAWAESAARSMTSVATDRDPGLVCGDREVIVLGDGDDDLTAMSFAPGDASPRPTLVAIRDADFGSDEEREHDAYTVGDDLGLVRLGSSGAIAMRDVPHGGAATPWRRLKHSIPADDDVVAVDGDARATVIVFTEDAEDACPGVGSAGERVHALLVDRKTSDETLLDLAPAACDRTPGPFWIAAAAPAGPTVAWVEHTAGQAAKAPPILGASFRALLADGVKPGRVDQPADALVDSGCDDKGCSFAALVRPPGADGMQPEVVATFPYP